MGDQEEHKDETLSAPPVEVEAPKEAEPLKEAETEKTVPPGTEDQPNVA
jgi:hypothetical protein